MVGAPEEPLRVVLIDDEALAREALRERLGRVPDVRIVGEYETGLEAVRALSTVESPMADLALLDIQMPELDGIGVIESLPAERRPEVIFVTAYDRYMDDALRVHAVDYLRKPIAEARFVAAIEEARRRVLARRVLAQVASERLVEQAVRSVDTRARTGVTLGAPPADPRGLAAATLPEAATRDVDGGARVMQTDPGVRRVDGLEGEDLSHVARLVASLREVRGDTRLAIEDRTNAMWELVRKDAIVYLASIGENQVRVRVAKKTGEYVWRKTIREVEATLDPHVFLRVNRLTVVNTQHIERVKSLQKGEYALQLSTGEMIDSGRRYREAIEAFLEGR